VQRLSGCGPEPPPLHSIGCPVKSPRYGVGRWERTNWTTHCNVQTLPMQCWSCGRGSWSVVHGPNAGSLFQLPPNKCGHRFRECAISPS
jgi:hypothetical protein